MSAEVRAEPGRCHVVLGGRVCTDPVLLVFADEDGNEEPICERHLDEVIEFVCRERR